MKRPTKKAVGSRNPEPGTMTLALLSSLAFIRRLRSRQDAAVGAVGSSL